jgi:1-aminocyclopropane-1-carboxylate deaminase
LLNLQLPSPLQEIYDPLLEEKELKLFIKREDLIHPVISGNKWRKLKYNLSKAKEEGHTTVLSFGGAYSNHIHALSTAAQYAGLRAIGIIRGEEVLPLNATLSDAKSFGMKLLFVSREEYKKKNEQNYINALRNTLGEFYLIPEGGSNEEGVKGCMEITEEIEIAYDYICLACGTGTTMAGVIAGMGMNKKAIGFPVLKGGDFLYEEIKNLLTSNHKNKNWHLETGYHFGGYAKWNEELLNFMNDFKNNYSIPLDQVYTGKMMFGLMDKIKKDHFEKGSVIVALHTGGLQGLSGINL